MKELHNNLKFTLAIGPVVITGNGSTVGATIDTQSFGSLEFLLQSGVITDGGFTTEVYEGDAANMSDEALVADAELLGTEADASFIVSDDSTTKKIGYRGNKRYVRLKLVQAGATTGGLMSVTAVQGRARNAPVA